jgi:Fungalysin metallopeptidase (M36)
MDRRAVRESSPGSETQQTAVEKLRRELPGVEVQFDAITNGPSHIMAVGRVLAPAGAAGGAAEKVTGQFIDAHADLFGHGGAVLQDARVTRDDVTEHSGLVTRVWQQQLDGVPLYQTILKANLTRRGELLTLGSHFLADPAAASALPEPQRARLITQPPITASAAISGAAADQVRATNAPEGAERRQRFEAPGLSDVTAGLCWLPMDERSLRLAWDVTLMSTQLGQMYRTVLDAQTGEVLVRSVLTVDATDASYRVYASAASKKPLESPAPMLPGTPTPSAAQAPEVARSLVTLQSLDAVASPNGWIDDGGAETLGNNVQAHTDTNADNAPDLPRPMSATRVFDFPVDLTRAPSTYRDASVTHLFYLNNWMHDALYALGFTESAGNFQTNNFGRGGLGNDAVLRTAAARITPTCPRPPTAVRRGCRCSSLPVRRRIAMATSTM